MNEPWDYFSTSSGLGALLIAEQVLSEQDVSEAIVRCQRFSMMLSHYLVQSGLLCADILHALCVTHYKLPKLILKNCPSPIAQEVLDLVPEKWIQQYRLLPIALTRYGLQLGLTDPSSFSVLSRIRFHLGLSTELFLLNESELDQLLLQRFPNSYQVALQNMVNCVQKRVVEPQELLVTPNDEDETQNPVELLLNQILQEASKQEASDIHIEPLQREYRVRMRIHGILHEWIRLPFEVAQRVSTRLKLLAGMDIAEKRLPQDGRFQWHAKAEDLRLNACPTLHGEKLVLRRFGRGQTMTLSDLELPKEQLHTLQSVLQEPQGLILVAGPTGSGKTTTLYAMLNELNAKTRNIYTIEDPIECRLPFINQVPVNERIHLDFPEILRALLRQDPDVIMLSEIRDVKTAAMALRAASTGHLVLGSVHANNSFEALMRLKLLQLNLQDVLQVTILIAAQRLVRKLCSICQMPASDHPEVLPPRVKSCVCREGYLGRIALFEMLQPDSLLREEVANTIPLYQSEARLKKQGWQSLQDMALNYVGRGICSLADIKSVIGGLYAADKVLA